MINYDNEETRVFLMMELVNSVNNNDFIFTESIITKDKDAFIHYNMFQLKVMEYFYKKIMDGDLEDTDKIFMWFAKYTNALQVLGDLVPKFFNLTDEIVKGLSDKNVPEFADFFGRNLKIFK